MNRLKSLLPKKLTKNHYIFIVILTFSAIFRLYNIPNTVQFLGDQGRDALIVSNIFKELDPVFIGPVTSVGNMYLGPLYYYFMVPFMWLTYPSPMGPAYTMAVIGILTVFLMYYLGKQFLNERIALIASGLFGFSAIVAQNTRFSWNPNPAPIVSLLMLFFTFKAVKKDVRYWIAVTICFAVLIQLHYLTLLSGAGFGLVWIYQLTDKLRHKKSVKKMFIATLISALVFAMSLTPLILFDFKHDGLNRNAFISIITKEDTFAKDAVKGSSSVNKLVSDLKNRTELILAELTVGKRDKVTDSVVSFSILGIFLYIIISRTRGKKITAGELVITSFLITGILGTAAYKHSVYYHYIGYLFPVAFFVTASVIDFLLKKKILGKIIVAAFLLLFIQFNLEHGKLILTDAGSTIAKIQSAAKTIEDRVQPGEKYNIVLLTGTGDIDGQNYRYFLSTSDKPPVSEENRGDIETLFIINDDRVLEKATSSPVYEIVVFPNKEPVEVYDIPDGPEITVLKKESK